MADLGIILVYIGERKNLRGAQRRVGNVCKTPRGFHFYDGKHWQQMDVPEMIETEAFTAKPQADATE
jgi:hypothetical protein